MKDSYDNNSNNSTSNNSSCLKKSASIHMLVKMNKWIILEKLLNNILREIKIIS